MRKAIVIVLVVLFGGLPAFAQTAVEEAVREGLELKPGEIGLYVKESNFSFRSLGARGFHVWSKGPLGKYEGGSALGMRIFTPTAWIQFQAAKAKAQYRTFSASDVTSEMEESILRIFVKHAVLSHMVLRSADKKVVVQPTASGQYQEAIYFKDTVEVSCQEFRFAMSDFAKVREGEFIVTLLGTSEEGSPMERDFRVKGKDLKRLP